MLNLKNFSDMTTIDLEKTTVTLRNDGILHIHLKSGSEINIQDAEAVFSAMEKLGNKKKHPVLIDAGEFIQIDNEVQQFSASAKANIYTIADAIAYYSLGQKLLAGFYIKLNNPVVPTQMFPNKQEAIDWLKTFAQN
jgi:hypothetical protein